MRSTDIRAALYRALAATGGLLLLLCAVDPASAQVCPSAGGSGPGAPSPVRSLEGRLVYHKGIRKWFELQMGRPECGQASIQVTSEDRDLRTLQSLRGCWIRATGPLDFAPTGYYSKDVYLHANRVTPVGICAKKAPFPDWSRARPTPAIRSYRVTMDVDYRPGDRPIVFNVRSAGRELRPWQAYASYMLTGGYVLYGLCGEAFAVDRVAGPREAHPSHFGDPGGSDGMAAFDPEGAAVAGKTYLRLVYTCVRIKRRTAEEENAAAASRPLCCQRATLHPPQRRLGLL
jgi:hypothetical protein